MQITRLDRHPEFVETVVDWIISEWGSTHESVKEVLLDNKACPPALLALNSARPIGILGYKIHLLQTRGSHELWINALYVVPQSRRLGVGSQLVREAANAAACSNRDSLFAYTDIPTFYEALGWQRFSYVEEAAMHIVEWKIQPMATTTNVIEAP